MQEAPHGSSSFFFVPVVSERTGKEESAIASVREVIWLVRNFNMDLRLQAVNFNEEQPQVSESIVFHPAGHHREESCEATRKPQEVMT